MTRNALFLLPLVLLFLAFVPRSEGMVFNKHGENVRNKLVVLTKTFELLEGGHVDVELEPTWPTEVEGNLKLLMCSINQLAEFSPSVVIRYGNCNESLIPCSFVQSFNESGYSTRINITKYASNYLLIFNCVNKTTPYNVKAHVVLMNPGGEHLVCGLLSMPTIYAFTASIWAILLVKNVLRTLATWKRATLVQLFFIIIALLKIVFASLVSAQWSQVSKNGFFLHNTLMFFAGLFGAFFYLTYFGLMFMLASGWAVTRKGFLTKKIAFVLISVVVLTVFGGLDAASVGGYYSSMLIGTGFFVFRIVGVVYGYGALSKEMSELSVQSVGPVVWGAHVGSAQYVANERLQVLIDLRYVIGTWGVLDTVLYFMLFLFMQDETWIPSLAFEVLLVFFYVFLTFIMRARKYPILPLEGAQTNEEMRRRPIHNENVLRRAAQMINERNDSSSPESASIN